MMRIESDIIILLDKKLIKDGRLVIFILNQLNEEPLEEFMN